jgi:hypothetical protein
VTVTTASFDEYVGFFDEQPSTDGMGLPREQIGLS